MLDKLAAGWKCRRKSWEKGTVIAKEACTSTVSWWKLLSNDWEGEPPEPVLSYKGVDIVTAFRHLKGGAAFIRRTSWGKTQITSKPAYVNISGCDILANDWEVWG